MMFKRIFANFVSQTVVIKLLSYVCTYGLLCLIIGFSEFRKYKKFGQTENNVQSKSLFMEDKNYVSF